MPPRPLAVRALCALVCLIALSAGSASAATKKKSKLPTISSVAPMTLGVGDTLTIRGTNFRSGNRRNTVVFKRDGSRAVFVKAGSATKTVMKVKVPASLLQYLPKVADQVTASRFRLRVLAARFSRGYTPLGKSPTIGPASVAPPGAPGSTPVNGSPIAPVTTPPSIVPPDCDADGTPDAVDGDDDDDLLSDALEAAIKTSPCNADSDADGMTDGFEYQSAIDLNNGVGSLPYPGKRPYPNPLHADAVTDYDGDGLTAGQEYALWRYAGPASLPLSYSAGLKRTTGPVDDDLRDADADGLGNWIELNGPMVPAWWQQMYTGEKPYDQEYSGTSAVDPDSDGDGVLDGADDQDFDGWSNLSEIKRTTHWVQPYNPCLPDYTSRTCSSYIPFGDVYPPFPLPDPPPPTPLTWP
jgi:hypothetical protein